MNTMATIRRLALAALLAFAPAAMVGCGNSNGGQQVASDHAGPIGPTSPGGYYFEMTVTPHTITSGSNVVAQIQVYDNQGNTAPGVMVALVGDNSDPKEAFGTTGSGGWVRWAIQIGYPPNSYVYLTASVEDKTLTVPVYVAPGTITGGFTGSNG